MIQREKGGDQYPYLAMVPVGGRSPLFLDCDILPQVDGSSNHHNSKFDLDESALAGVLSFFIHHTRGVLGAIEKPKPLF